MRNAPIFRTVIALAYLLALVAHGRWDGRTGGLVLAVAAVWAVPLIRDARRGRTVGPSVSAR